MDSSEEPEVPRGDHSSPIGPFSPSSDPSPILSDGGRWYDGGHVPPSIEGGWQLLLLTPLKGAGFCNDLGVVGAKSGAGSSEFRGVLFNALTANISHPTKHRVHTNQMPQTQGLKQSSKTPRIGKHVNLIRTHLSHKTIPHKEQAGLVVIIARLINLHTKQVQPINRKGEKDQWQLVGR